MGALVPGLKQTRFIAVALGVGLVGVLAILLRHELVDSKPYKIVSPLQSVLAVTGAWLPLLLVAAGLLVALGVAGRSAVGAPVAAAAAGVAVALAVFASVMLVWGSTVPVDGDFGSTAVWSAFRQFLVVQGGGVLAGALAASLFVGVLQRRVRDAV
jgi:hypothetical protein